MAQVENDLLLRLCSMASIAAGNNDLTRDERNHLRDLANEVSREVIKQINDTGPPVT